MFSTGSDLEGRNQIGTDSEAQFKKYHIEIELCYKESIMSPSFFYLLFHLSIHLFFALSEGLVVRHRWDLDTLLLSLIL
jgi:hypothetical protein